MISTLLFALALILPIRSSTDSRQGNLFEGNALPAARKITITPSLNLMFYSADSFNQQPTKYLRRSTVSENKKGNTPNHVYDAMFYGPIMSDVYHNYRSTGYILPVATITNNGINMKWFSSRFANDRSDGNSIAVLHSASSIRNASTTNHSSVSTGSTTNTSNNDSRRNRKNITMGKTPQLHISRFNSLQGNLRLSTSYPVTSVSPMQPTCTLETYVVLSYVAHAHCTRISHQHLHTANVTSSTTSVGKQTSSKETNLQLTDLIPTDLYSKRVDSTPVELLSINVSKITSTQTCPRWVNATSSKYVCYSNMQRITVSSTEAFRSKCVRWGITTRPVTKYYQGECLSRKATEVSDIKSSGAGTSPSRHQALTNIAQQLKTVFRVNKSATVLVNSLTHFSALRNPSKCGKVIISTIVYQTHVECEPFLPTPNPKHTKLMLTQHVNTTIGLTVGANIVHSTVDENSTSYHRKAVYTYHTTHLTTYVTPSQVSALALANITVHYTFFIEEDRELTGAIVLVTTFVLQIFAFAAVVALTARAKIRKATMILHWSEKSADEAITTV